MQTVCHFDKYHADIFCHSEQKFAEIFRLHRCFISKDSTGNLCQSVDYDGYFFAEIILDIFYGIFRVFDHVVEKCRTNRGRAQTYFLAHYFGNGYWVEDVWLA